MPRVVPKKHPFAAEEVVVAWQAFAFDDADARQSQSLAELAFAVIILPSWAARPASRRPTRQRRRCPTCGITWWRHHRWSRSSTTPRHRSPTRRR